MAQGDAVLKICLNPYSPRYPGLKAASFLLPFGSAVLDPIEEEKAGRAYLPDADFERKEQAFTKLFSLYDPVLLHLAKKYQTGQLTRADFKSPQIAVKVT